uniref:AlNc14C52G4031 protein n=1 Tax=Albugo laibachii Nc14 TaxID=890382 RepID=F0WBI5_9STRA|nr:AlNc14C52G4031 [Albugo laibachii Nc14]|eukprot:CCA18512.1 AlNc14C52G4031 [Albugo laibachii Nc14]
MARIVMCIVADVRNAFLKPLVGTLGQRETNFLHLLLIRKCKALDLHTSCILMAY